MKRDQLQYQHQLELQRIEQERQMRLLQQQRQVENERQARLEQQRQIENERAKKQAEENARAERERQERLAEKERLEREIAIMKVERAHPGWEKTIATPKFNSWREAQPTSVQRLADSPNADDAILMLDLYKKDTAKRSKRKK